MGCDPGGVRVRVGVVPGGRAGDGGSSQLLACSIMSD